MNRYLEMLKNEKREKSELTKLTAPPSDSFVSEAKGVNQNLEGSVDIEIERDVLQALINCGYCGAGAVAVASAIAKGNRDANSLEVMLMQS